MSNISGPNLFDPIRLGAIDAPNRILMAPLTRGRATLPGVVPNDVMRLYYEQRASAGLIITEATGISQEGLGWPKAPGIWTDAQVEGWKPIVEAVHQAGGRIMLQMWHMGRIVHSSFNDGKVGVSASATKAPGQAWTLTGKQDYEVARPLELAEIPRLLADYVHAAENAKKAGFDGVQIHSANGYLIDQFLRDGTNLRDDDYGGSIENRIRLLKEVTEAVIGVWGADRVAVRLSPNGDSQGVDDSNPEKLFTAAAAMLNDLGIAFLELREPGPDGTFGKTDVPKQSPAIRKVFHRPLVLNSDLTGASGNELIESGLADAISYGRPFIANPDLVTRLEHGAVLNEEKPMNWYVYNDPNEGYTDFPTLAEMEAAE